MTFESERRSNSRIPVEMWVEESTDHELYFQRSANLSEGGLFLENTIPHPIGKVVTLSFTLPGDSQLLTVLGEIVNTPDPGQLGMGVKFLEVDEATQRRIQGFVERERVSLSEPAETGDSAARR